MPPIYLTSDLLSYKRKPNLFNPLKKTISNDPYFDNVVLYLRGDGTNGSTTVVDESPTPKSISVFGNAQISTTQSKYGGSSIYFDGSGDYLESFHDVNIAVSEDYCFESWCYTSTNTGTNKAIITINTTTDNGESTFQLAKDSFDSAKISVSQGGGPIITATISYPVAEWFHIAVTRSSDTLQLFQDGILVGSITRTEAVSGGKIKIGINRGENSYWNGYIDSLRITKGLARYTANFDPETDTHLAY